MNRTRTHSIVGVNIQYPWSRLLVSGEKTVETRKYPLPVRYRGVPLAIIETPGKHKPKFRARIIGVIKFSGSIEYKNAKEWEADKRRHLVAKSDPMFCFKEGEPKHGWVVKSVTKFSKPVNPPTKRGIVFALECKVPAFPL